MRRITCTCRFPGFGPTIMLDEHFRSRSSGSRTGTSTCRIEEGSKLEKTASDCKRCPLDSSNRRDPAWQEREKLDQYSSLKKIQDLKQRDSRSLSVGVVTPFKAQKDFLRDRLDALRLASEVLVDTAHGFQGDERDQSGRLQRYNEISQPLGRVAGKSDQRHGYASPRSFDSLVISNTVVTRMESSANWPW